MESSIINIPAEWVKEAKNLKTGQTIYINLETRDEQRMFLKELNKELERYRKLMPIEAATIITGKVFRDARFWVFLRKAAATPYIGFIKDSDGSLRRLSLLADDDDRMRRLRLMIEDGITMEELIESEEDLTQEEKETLWPSLRR
jgi:hypothetical protein